MSKTLVDAPFVTFQSCFHEFCFVSVFSAPPGLQEYLLSVELNFLDVSALNQLKTLLNRTVFPFSINDSIKVSDVNITMGREQTNRTNVFTPKVDFCLSSNECLCTVSGSWTTCCRRNPCRDRANMLTSHRIASLPPSKLTFGMVIKVISLKTLMLL